MSALRGVDQRHARGHAGVSGRRGHVGAPIWVTRAGVEVVTIGAEIRKPANPRLSPDGKRLVLVAGDDLWEYNLQGRPPVKLTAESRVASPLWTPDGKSLVYESGNVTSLRIIAAAAGATPQPASPDGHYHPHGWSPDGRDLIVAQVARGETGWDIVRFAPNVKSQPQFVVKTPATEGVSGTALSPDGRWLAYVSDTTGRAELWVQAFPGPGSPVRVSSRGGVEPIWARNGRELYYLEGNKLMAVAVGTTSEFNFKAPVLLFEFRYQRSRQPPWYHVGVDGRFLVIKPSNATTTLGHYCHFQLGSDGGQLEVTSRLLLRVQPLYSWPGAVAIGPRSMSSSRSFTTSCGGSPGVTWAANAGSIPCKPRRSSTRRTCASSTSSASSGRTERISSRWRRG